MELVIVAIALVPIVIALARIVFPRTDISFEDLLRRTDLEWPRGVQEEEPVPWHVERLQPRSRP